MTIEQWYTMKSFPTRQVWYSNLPQSETTTILHWIWFASCLLSIDTVFSKSNIWINFSSSIRLYLRVLWRCKIWLTWLLWRNNHFLFPVHAFQATPHPLLSISEGKFTNDKNNVCTPNHTWLRGFEIDRRSQKHQTLELHVLFPTSFPFTGFDVREMILICMIYSP